MAASVSRYKTIPQGRTGRFIRQLPHDFRDPMHREVRLMTRAFFFPRRVDAETGVAGSTENYRA